MSEEVWKVVPSLPEMEASSWGRVRKLPRYGSGPRASRRLYVSQPRTGFIGNGCLRIEYRGKCYSIHRLVCEAFNGPAPPDKPVCMHLDEDFRNNRPENLAWGTQTENLNAPKLRAWWTPERHAEARRKGWVTRKANQESA